MINQSTCEHSIVRPDLEIVLVLELQVQIIEALAKCRHCEAHYRIRAIDQSGTTVLYQLNRLRSEHVRQTVRSVSRGSCSIERARDEVNYLKSQSQKCEHLIISNQGQFTKTVPISLINSKAQSPDMDHRNFNGEWLKLISSCARID